MTHPGANNSMLVLVRNLSVILLLASIQGCDDSVDIPETTLSSSDQFTTLTEKVAFLERYVNFRRAYEDLAFLIDYRNNGGGFIPGPSEWDIRILASVPEHEIEQWTGGMEKTRMPDIDWMNSLPAKAGPARKFDWYRSGADTSGRVVGVDRKRRRIVYRTWNY